MSKDIRTEQERQVAELRALIRGQAAELARMETELDECERRVTALILTISKQRDRIRRLELRLRAAGAPTNGELDD